jgi:hypothetical protein
MNDPATKSDQQPEESLRKTRVKLSALFLMSVAPFVLAYIVFFVKPEWIPTGTTNHGELLLPPIQADEVGIDHKAIFEGDRWMFVIPVGITCDQGCIDALYYTRQVKTALGKESGRIERILLSSTTNISDEFEALLQQEHKYARLVFSSGVVISALVEPLLGRKPRDSYILLMDPNGNIMMFYTLDKAGKLMLKDVKHLLKASNIG